MTNNEYTRTPEEIEAEIAQERSALNRTIHSLQDRISVDGIVRNMGDSLQEHGSEIGQAVARTVRQNPTAVALTAIGLTWLAISSGRSSNSTEPYSGPRRRPVRPMGDTTPMSPAAPPRGPVPTGHELHGSVDHDDHDSPWERTRDRIRRSQQDARDQLDAATGRARDHASATGDGVRAKAGSAKAGLQRRFQSSRDSARAQAERVGSSAQHLRDRISDGTKSMSDQARERVVAARSKAYEAQVRAEYLAREGRDRAANFYEDQPLVVGALAVAVGAAIGSALPRTRQENEAFGAYRDDLFEEADHIYREELEKLKSVASATADEARNQASKTVDDAKSSVKSAESSLEARAKAVADTAREEAERKDLGKPSTQG